MHVAFVAPPLAGHLDPLRAVAGELARRGHRATLVGRPDARRWWAGDGLGFSAIGEDRWPAGTLDATIAALTRRGPLAMPAMLRELAGTADTLCTVLPDALRRLGPDVLVADQAEPAAALVAEHLGIPWVGTASALPLDRDDAVPPPWRAWSPDPSDRGRRANRMRWRIADALMAPVDRVLAGHARRLGVVPLPSYGRRPPGGTLTQLPPGLDFARDASADALAHVGPWRDARSGVPDPEVLAASAPIAFCSLGTMRGGRGALLAAATAACAGLGLRPVVAHGGRLGEGPAARLPGAPIVRAFVPQRAVLPRCAVAVVHGGLNTALDALAAGVPLVVMPLGFEQPGIAARLRYAGVAEVVSPAAPALRRRLRAALARVLQGAHRARAAHWSATIAACGGAVTVADRIEAAAAAAARAAA